MAGYFHNIGLVIYRSVDIVKLINQYFTFITHTVELTFVLACVCVALT